MLVMAPAAVKAQLGTQWDSFYQDFTRTTSTGAATKKQAKSPQQQQKRQAGQQAKPAEAAPRPTFVDPSTLDPLHRPNSWEIDVRYKMSEGQFMFETDVGSKLNWDEAFSGEIDVKILRDFMVKNYQLVAEVGFSKGSLTTSRTSDDDVFNELHIFSLGNGSANLSSWNVGIGIRNIFKFGGFEITPFIGWKQKRQDLQMADHVAPAPFFLDYFCEQHPNLVLADQGICADIDMGYGPLSFLLGLGSSKGYIYIRDTNGNVRRPTSSEMEDVAVIPGAVDTSYGQVVNLSWKMLVPDEDFCYLTKGQLTACIERTDGDGYNNIADVFGGVSSLNDQRGFTTHIYNVTWSGPYIGATAERPISIKETIKLYGEIFKPVFRAEGTWPLRSDWAQFPSFIDEGSSAWGFLAELEYRYRFNQKASFTAGVSREWIKATGADTTLFFSDGSSNVYSGSIHYARWKNTSMSLGLAFNL